MTIRYVVYQKKSESTINVKVTFGRGQQLFSKTPFTVDHRKWNSLKQKTRGVVIESGKETLNDKLAEFKKYISDSVTRDTGKGIDFNKHWLKRILKEYQRGGKDVEEFDFYLDKYAKKFMFAATLVNRFYEFQSDVSYRLQLETQNNRLSIIDINHRFSEDYANFLLKMGFTVSHVRQELARFKMLLKQLRKDGKIVYLDDWFVPKGPEPPLPMADGCDVAPSDTEWVFRGVRADRVALLLAGAATAHVPVAAAGADPGALDAAAARFTDRAAQHVQMERLRRAGVLRLRQVCVVRVP